MDVEFIYHITFKSNVKSIKALGLVCRKLSRKRAVWSNNFGAKQGDPGFVYFTNDFYEAVRFGARLEWHQKKDVVILKIKHVPSEYEPDVHFDNMYNTWFKTRESINAKYIVDVIDLTLEHKRELVQYDRQRVG